MKKYTSIVAIIILLLTLVWMRPNVGSYSQAVSILKQHGVLEFENGHYFYYHYENALSQDELDALAKLRRRTDNGIYVINDMFAE